jgi:hypothetical protein
VAVVCLACAATAEASPLTLDTASAGVATPLSVGEQVALLGDANGDGVPDVAYPELKRPGCLHVRVSFRRAGDWSESGGFTIVDSRGGCLTDGRGPIAAAGDVNGDGRPDLVLLVSRQTRTHVYAPAGAFVVFGKPDGSPVDLAKLGNGGLAISDPKGSFGSEVSVAHGDFNGDGQSDLVLAAQSGPQAAAPALIFGKADGASVDLRTAPRVRVPSGDHVTYAGFSDDMTGDGRAELIVRVSSDQNVFRGTWVVFGRPGTAGVVAGDDPNEFSVDSSVVGVGDVNGDGRPDLASFNVVVFGKADPAPVVTAKNAPFGGFRVGDMPGCGGELDIGPQAAGDVNGDSLADVLLDCVVVFGKRDTKPVDVFSPSGASFVVGGRTRSVVNLQSLADVTGDGRVDFFSGGSRPFLVRGPAVVTSQDPIAAPDSGNAAVPVLCLTRTGCNGSMSLSTSRSAACGGSSLTAGESAGSASFGLGDGEVGEIEPTIAPSARELATCLLGLPVDEHIDVTDQAYEQSMELIPAVPPTGPPWRALRAQTIRGQADDFFAWLDPVGTPFGVFARITKRQLDWYTFRLGTAARRLPLVDVDAAPLGRGRLLLAGGRQSGRHTAPYVAIARPGGALTRVRALDRGHYVEGSVALATAPNGNALAAWPRRVRRTGASWLVARFVTRGGLGRVSPVLRHSAYAEGADTAINSRGDGLVAWCSDPYVGLTTARHGQSFGRVQDLVDNEEGACGDNATAVAPDGRFAWIWVSWVDPYNDDDQDYPTEIKVAVGHPGGRFRVIPVDSSGAVATQQAPVGIAFVHGHLIAGYTSYDELTGTTRVTARDLTTGTRRWLSPPQSDGVFGSMAVRRDGVLAIAWTTANYDEGSALDVYASVAPRDLAFAPPEHVGKSGAAAAVDSSPPQVAFSPRGRPRAVWLERPRGASIIRDAQRP